MNIDKKTHCLYRYLSVCVPHSPNLLCLSYFLVSYSLLLNKLYNIFHTLSLGFPFFCRSFVFLWGIVRFLWQIEFITMPTTVSYMFYNIIQSKHICLCLHSLPTINDKKKKGKCILLSRHLIRISYSAHKKLQNICSTWIKYNVRDQSWMLAILAADLDNYIGFNTEE